MQRYEHLVFVFLILSQTFSIILNNISLTTRSVVVTVINVFQRRFDIFYPMGALNTPTPGTQSTVTEKLKTYQISAAK